MCTLDIIKQLLKKQKKTQLELCQYIGVSKQAFTEWNGGRNTSYKKYLPQIAEFFNVSVDYLLGKQEKPSAESEELIRKLLNTPSNKATVVMFGGDGPKVVEISPEDAETVRRMLEALDKKD